MKNLFVVALLVIGLTTFAQEKGKKGVMKTEKRWSGLCLVCRKL